MLNISVILKFTSSPNLSNITILCIKYPWLSAITWGSKLVKPSLNPVPERVNLTWLVWSRNELRWNDLMIWKRRRTSEEKFSIHKTCGKISFSFISLFFRSEKGQTNLIYIRSYTAEKWHDPSTFIIIKVE